MNVVSLWLKVHFILSLSKQLGFWLGLVFVYCIIVFFIEYYFNIKLGEMSAEAGLINTIILSLLMSFRNRTAYDRWWEGRRLWGQLVNDCRNLATKLAAYVPHEKLEQVSMAKMIAAFPVALKWHLRSYQKSVTELPGFEQETSLPPHLPIFVASRIIAQVAKFHRDGVITEMMFRNVDSHLNAMLDVCGACERIQNTPIPFSYKAMLRTGLVLHFAIAPWYTISAIGYRGIPVLMLVCFFLLGVELIDSHIEDPFGHDEDDLDLERYSETIGKNVHYVLGSDVDHNPG
jgi:ion channel-forming bestrophin family protein